MPGASAACCAPLLAACGGGSGGGTAATSPPPAVTPPPPPLASADAARLLEQATFGVTASDLTHVQSVGIDAYINEQLAYAPTQYTGFSYTPHTAPAGCKSDGSNPPDASSLCARDQYSPFQVQRAFFTHALNNPDQLRQRVAFALSQIMVVSSVEIYEAYGLADFQNMLLRDALGNYRTLLAGCDAEPDHGSLPRHGEQRRDQSRKPAPSRIRIMRARCCNCSRSGWSR